MRKVEGGFVGDLISLDRYASVNNNLSIRKL